MANNQHRGAFVFGAILGAVSGAVAALLTTPKRGDDLRNEVLDRVKGVQSRAEAMTADVRERGETLAAQGRAQVNRVTEVASERAPFIRGRAEEHDRVLHEEAATTDAAAVIGVGQVVEGTDPRVEDTAPVDARMEGQRDAE